MRPFLSGYIQAAVIGMSVVTTAMSAVVNLDKQELSVELKKLPVSERELFLEGSASAAELELIRTLSDSVKILDLSKVVLPERALPPYFLFKTGVEHVILPNDLKGIGDWCFAESALKEITIPSSVENLGLGAFYICQNLESVNLGNSNVSSIPGDIFYGCSSLSKLELPAGILSVGDNAFRKSGLKSLNIQNVSKIGNFAFAEMKSLSSISLNAGAHVGEGVFYGDSVLNSIFGSFENIAPLLLTNTSVNDIGYSGEEIGDGAFANIPVDTLYLGEKIKRIGDNAFRKMQNLKEVNVVALRSDLPETATSAFSGVDTSAIPLMVASDSSEAWRSHPVWGSFIIREFSDASVKDVPEEIDVNATISYESGILTIVANQPIAELGIYTSSGACIGTFHPDTNIFRSRIEYDAPVLIMYITSGNKRIIKKVLHKAS